MRGAEGTGPAGAAAVFRPNGGLRSSNSSLRRWAPAGAGLVVAALLVAGVWLQRRRRPQSLELAPGRGSRLLGPSLVVHWQAHGRTGAVWLTPGDLPREILRSLAVRLVAGR